MAAYDTNLNGASRRTDDAPDQQVNAPCRVGEGRGIGRPLSTHPPAETRIQRLRS